MRCPKRKRPLPSVLGEISDYVDLEGVAQNARYTGSPEHKRHPSPAGPAAPRTDASLCDKAMVAQWPDLTKWLREAIRQGHVAGPWENGFPRTVWCRKDGDAYQARLMNQGTGEYKGWPIAVAELPEGI